MNDMQKSMIQRDLENFFYWKTLLEQDVFDCSFFSNYAINTMHEYFFNVARTIHQCEENPDADEWQQMCETAKESAKIRFYKDRTENKD